MSPQHKHRTHVTQPVHKPLSPSVASYAGEVSQPSPNDPQPPSLEAIISSLRSGGLRLTSQRESILHIFYHLPEGEHLSAEELLQRVQATDETDISLATAYRTLKLLASVGVLRELDFAEDHKHYEFIRNPESPHHHIICVSCGGTDEFESPEALQLAQSLASQQRFQLTDVQIKLFGLCPDCQANNEPRPFGLMPRVL
jgi:Fur family transcriptional regulator, ferric uptake regulator